MASVTTERNQKRNASKNAVESRYDDESNCDNKNNKNNNNNNKNNKNNKNNNNNINNKNNNNNCGHDECKIDFYWP